MLHSLLIPPIRDTAKSCRCSGQSSVPVYSICTTINKWLNHHKEQPNTTSGKPTSAHAIFSPMWIRVRHCNSAVKWHGKNFGLWLQSIYLCSSLQRKQTGLQGGINLSFFIALLLTQRAGPYAVGATHQPLWPAALRKAGNGGVGMKRRYPKVSSASPPKVHSFPVSKAMHTSWLGSNSDHPSLAICSLPELEAIHHPTPQPVVNKGNWAPPWG